MISVSVEAKEVLVESLKESGVGPEQGLRLKAQQQGFALEVDRPSETDRVIEHNGSNVLIVDEQVEEIIGEALIDLEEGVDGYQLTIRQLPNG